jgi:glycerophosphoryl diester phosphodiesterase
VSEPAAALQRPAQGTRRRPLVIAHRGASGERPEHTLSSYELAIAQGADLIEPDLVPTRDGVLVARHENEISETTNVAEKREFERLRTTKIIDGTSTTGWFTEDFTLAELKTLRAKERLPAIRPGNMAYDGHDSIPTFAEVIALANRAGVARGRPVGIYPETKHPSYFRSLGLPVEQTLVDQLHASGHREKSAPVFIQSFEVNNLRMLRSMTDLPIIQLVLDAGTPPDGAYTSYADMLSETGLRKIAEYANGIGAQKSLLMPRDQANKSLPPTDFVKQAHEAGLLVHPWTFRSENAFLPTELRTPSAEGTFPAVSIGNWAREYGMAFDLGVDAVFSDWPRHALEAATRWMEVAG